MEPVEGCMFCDERPEEAEYDPQAGGYSHVECMEAYEEEQNRDNDWKVT